MILDDVFAELDSSRRHHLVDLISSAEQVLITAAVDEDIPEALRDVAKIYTIDELKNSALSTAERAVKDGEADGD